MTGLVRGQEVAHGARRRRQEDGSIVWQGDLPTRTNAPLTIAGDTLVTAASYPEQPGQLPKIVAYRLGDSAR